MRLVELRFGSSVPDLLRQLRTEGLNAGQVAERLDVPYGTLHRWLIRFELDDSSLIRRALRTGDGGPVARCERATRVPFTRRARMADRSRRHGATRRRMAKEVS
jgi:hypothetical protein